MDNFISKIPNTNPDLIVQMEIITLYANDFRPPQFSPIPCVYGFLLDALPIIEKIAEYQDILQAALDRLQVAFMMDEIMLVESPAHIAIACVINSDKDFEAYELNCLSYFAYFISFISSYWEERLNKLSGIEDLYRKIERIRQKIDNYSDISSDILRPIDLKIRSAKSEIVE